MFNFLNSTVLFAAAAALIPLIIHLFFRRRVKVVEFSSLKHLKQMQKRQVRRLKVRQLLLLILRMLIILLAVLAFARPTTEKGALGSHAAVSAVIIFDNSASMDRYVTDGNLFDLAKKRTEKLLEVFGEADQIYLLPMVLPEEQQATPGFVSAATIKEELDRLKVGYHPGELRQALEKAQDIITTSKNLNREIFIVTDRQRNLLPDTRPQLDSLTRMYFLDLPFESNDNLAVTAVDFGGQLIMPGHDFDIAATVKNFGNEDQREIIASLFINGNRVGQTDLEVAANNEETVRFTRSVSRTGYHSGYVELSDDRLMIDNRYYFSFNIPEQFNLLVISNDASGSFLTLALTPSETLDQYWSVKQVTPQQLSGVNLWDYDVVMLAGAPPLRDTYVKRLKSFVESGKGLFVSYGRDTDIINYNSSWSGVTSVWFDEPISEEFSRAGYYSFLAMDVNHPVFSVFNFENNQPPKVKFYTLPKLHLVKENRTLLRFTGDRPALVETTYGRGKVLTFTGPIAAEYSDLTGHAFFVPFVSRIAEYLVSDLSSYDLKLYTDDNITRAVSLKGSVSSSLELVTPDSSVHSIPPEEEQGALVLRANPTDQPGIYRISYLGREIDRFAVNVNPVESNLSRVDLEELSVAMGVKEYNTLGYSGELAGIISELRYGRELWQLFLWIAAVVLLVEILLSRSASLRE